MQNYLITTDQPKLLLIDIDGCLNALPYKTVWAGENPQPGPLDPEVFLSKNWKTVVDESIITDPAKHYQTQYTSMEAVGYPNSNLFLMPELLEDVERVHQEDNGVQVAILSRWNQEAPLFNILSGLSVPYIPLAKPRMSNGEVEQKRSTVRDFLNNIPVTPDVAWFDDVIFSEPEKDDLLSELGGLRRLHVPVGEALMQRTQPEHGISRAQWGKALQFLGVN